MTTARPDARFLATPPRTSPAARRLSAFALLMAMTFAAFLIAASAGCAPRIETEPEEDAYTRTGVRTASAEVGPGSARVLTQALAELAARFELRRSLRLNDPELERLVRSDEFYRAVLDTIVRRAPVVFIAYDAETRTSTVSVRADPEWVAAELGAARTARSAHGIR
jgi:hypothetical protein